MEYYTQTSWPEEEDDVFEPELVHLSAFPPSPTAYTSSSSNLEVKIRGGPPWGFILGGGLSRHSTVTVDQIDPQGKAKAHGLQVNDRVHKINDNVVVEVDDATQIINSAFNTLTLSVRRGNAEHGSTPKSSRGSQDLGQDNEPGSKDDSIVYAESRSKSGTRAHRPKRRGESFNLRATNRERPQSWQAGSPSLNLGKPRTRRSIEARQSASVSEVNRLPSSSSVNNATSSESVTTSSSVSSGQQQQVMHGMHQHKSTPSLHYVPGGQEIRGASGMHVSDSWRGPGDGVAHSHQNLSLDHGGAPSVPQPRVMHKSFSYSNAGDRASWDSQPPKQRRSYGSDSGDHIPMMPHEMRHSHSGQRREQRVYPNNNNYENMSEYSKLQSESSVHTSSVAPMTDASYGSNPYLGGHPGPNEGHIPAEGAAGDRGSPSPPLPPVRDASSLKFIKVSQSNHEKYPSWPVTVTSRQNQSAKPMSSRTNSWSDHTHTTSEFPSKPKMAYNPALSTHTEEKLETIDTARKYLREDTGIKAPGEQSHFHQAVVDKLQGDLNIRQNFPINSQGELDIKNFKSEQPSYPHPTYDKDGKIKDIDKDYAVPSPPERDVSPKQQHVMPVHFTGEPNFAWNQPYSSHSGGEHAPPLPTTAPPPPAAQSSIASGPDPHQSFTSNVQFTVGAQGADKNASGYPVVVTTTRPYYNTSTQTETQAGGAHEGGERKQVVQREEKSCQVRQQSLLAGINPEDMPDNNSQNTSTTPTFTSTATTVNAATSPKEQSSFTYTQYQPPPHRNAPIVDRMQQEKRIPETISEGEESRPGAVTGAGLRNELERIHEHSPSQTTMLRKLSQELYYGQQTRYGMGMTNRLHNRDRKLSGETSPLRETQRPPDLAIQTSQATSQGPLTPTGQQGPESPKSPKVSPFERGNKVQMSLRKAYGIFDEVENYEPGPVRKSFGKHAKSASTSQVPAHGHVHKSQGSLDGRGSSYSDYADMNKAQQWQKSASGSDTKIIAEQARQDWKESGKYSAYETANNSAWGLKRTTSEQIRPIKERQAAQRSESLIRKEKNKHKLSDPESAREKRHKISDPALADESAGFGDRSADPNPGVNSVKEKRLSDSSDVFRNSGGFEGTRRQQPGARPVSSASSTDEKKRTSDPDLKTYTHHALMSFYEKKTGKRLSSSSMDSSISGSEKSVIKVVAPSPQRPEGGKKAFSLPRDAVPPPAEDSRRSSGAEGEMPSPLLLDTTSAADRSSFHSRSSSHSAMSPGPEYSPPLHPWGPTTAHDPKRNPVIGTPGKGFGCSAETSPASTLVIHHSKQNSEENDKNFNLSQFDDPSTHPKALMAQESSSTSSSPNRPTSQELNQQQKFGYQVTVNRSYGGEDEEEDKPPVLPPRNYRQPLADRNARNERPQPPPPPPSTQAEATPTPQTAFRSNVMTNDYDQTPQPDHYRDQLRAQSRRISQGPRGLLNPARFQQKSLPDMKTSISVSRPVDTRPTAQETSTPYPMVGDSPQSGMMTQAGSEFHPPSPNPSPMSNTSPQPSMYRSTSSSGPQKLFRETPSPNSKDGRQEARLSNPASLNNSANNSPRPAADSPGQSHVSYSQQPSTPHSYLSEKAIPPQALSAELNGMERRPDGHSPENSTAGPHLYTADSYIYKKSGNVRQGFGGNYRRSGEVSPVKSPLSPNLLVPGAEDSKSPLGEAPVTSHPVQVVAVSRYEETDLDRPHEKRYIEAPQGELPWQKVKVIHPTPKMDFIPQTGHAGELSPRVLADTRMPHTPNQIDSYSGYPSQNMRFKDDGDEEVEDVNESPSVRAFAHGFESGRFSPKPFERLSVDTQSRNKVSELRETILRRSNENLLQAVQLSGSRERLHRLSPATSRERLDKLPGSSTNSSQEFKEKVDNRNSLNNLQNNGTSSERNDQTDYSLGQSDEIIKPDYTNNVNTQPPATSNIATSLEKDTLEKMEEDEVFVKHPRQKSQEEVVYEQQAALLASQLKDKDKQLSEVIQPPPSRKMSVDYMSGLFKKEVKLNRRPSFLSSRPPGDGSEDVLPPPDVVPLKTESTSPEFSLESQKEQLASSLENKLRILRQEKKVLEGEMKENADLGKTVTAVVEKKAQQKECSKYKSYVDELDKVMHLLIFLSDKLAKAENDLLSLPNTASDSEKERLIKRRDQMSEKHEDAKSLKEGIDRRSRQVATSLKVCLTEDEFTDYEYFIQMKSKLNMEKQEIEDKIKLGEEQLKALRKSLDISEA